MPKPPFAQAPNTAPRRSAKSAPFAQHDAEAPKRDHHAFRGVPPPPTFDLDELAPSTLLSELEAAAILRNSTNTLAAWRLREDRRRDHRLAWLVLPNGQIRYTVGAIRAYLALGASPKKKPKPQDPPPAPPRRRRARPRTKAGTSIVSTATIHAPVPERRRTPRRPRVAEAEAPAGSSS